MADLRKSANSGDQYTMQDPRAQYPKPNYPEQPQKVPGLAKDMNPMPDHGEETYRGSGRLKGRKAVVTGDVEPAAASVASCS